MKRPFILGLTGSIGMGKSTTAKMFAEAGIPVWDADATVHALYSKNGAAILELSKAFPDAVVDGAIDRNRLRTSLKSDPSALKRLEAIVHPLTLTARNDFIADKNNYDIIVLDIPLLFEVGADSVCDAVVVVSASSEEQRARILQRGTMNADDLDLILARQMSDREKRARADYAIETHNLDDTRRAVQNLITKIRSRHA